MNRRDFIKESAAVVALAAMPKILKADGNAKMKILVLTGSPRKNGNSATLADNFIKGAEEAGHTVVRFDAAFKKVHPCIACNKCGMDGPCIFKDDFDLCFLLVFLFQRPGRCFSMPQRNGSLRLLPIDDGKSHRARSGTVRSFRRKADMDRRAAASNPLRLRTRVP